MDEFLQPFPAKFASPDGTANIFVAMSGQIDRRRSEYMHRHDFYELVWVLHGACTFFSDFTHIPVAEKTLIFISPGQLHDYFLESGSVQLLLFGFRPLVLPMVAQHLVGILPFDNTHRNPTLGVPDQMQAAIEQLFLAAHGRFDNRVSGWEPIVIAYLRTILTEAAYLLPETVRLQSAAATVQLTYAFQQALEKHFRQKRQVQDYAELLGVTRNYLVRAVRETTSTTPKQMLQERLLLEAKRLLIHTPYPVAKISEILAYPNATTFSRWFKKQTGLTPVEFRRISPLV